MRSDAATAMLAALIMAVPAAAADFTVRVQEPDGRPLAHAVVLIDAEPAVRGVRAPGDAVVDQVDRAFVPHVSVVRTGTRVHFPNSDDIRHHVYSFSAAKSFELPLYKGTPATPVEFDRAGLVTLACNIHDWMLAFVYVADAEWQAVTGDDGVAVVPVDEYDRYSVTVWHPRLGPDDTGVVQIVEPAGASPSLTVTIDADAGEGVRRLRRTPGRYR